MANFLDERHPEYSDMLDKYEFAWDNYTGEYIDDGKLAPKRDRKKADLLGHEGYLIKKAQAEHNDAFLERTRLPDPILLFPLAIDSINGMLNSKKEETKREFGALGDHEEDEESIAYRLFRNADGRATNWIPLMKQVGIRLTTLHRVWGLVDGVSEDETGAVIREATINVLNPQSVVNWWPSTGRPLEVLVEENIDTREGLRDVENSASKTTYMFYHQEGWQRLIKTEETFEVIDEGEYEYYDTKEKYLRVPPIFFVDLPMPRNLGYLLAKKQNHIFNQKSIRDFSIRNMAFAFLQIVAEKDEYEEALSDIKKGFRTLRKDPEARGEHDYKSPPSDYLSEANAVLNDDKEDFLSAAFRAFGDAAKQVTATEIRHESRSGIEAFLSLLVTSMDEFENRAMFLLEQTYLSESAGEWGQANVERSKDFTPKDVEEAMKKISESILNLDRARAISTREKVKRANPDWTDEEIDAEVKAIRDESGAIDSFSTGEEDEGEEITPEPEVNA